MSIIMVKVLLLAVLILTVLFSPLFPSAKAIWPDIPKPTLSIANSHDDFIEYGNVGQQLVLEADFESNIDARQPFTAILEVRDSMEATSYLAWSSNVVSPRGNMTVGIPWTPLKEDIYEVRAFALSGFDDPQILSPVVTKTIEVIDPRKSMVIFVERYGEPSFETMNYTLKEAQELSTQIFNELRCRIHRYTEADDPNSYRWWLPEIVDFEYLKPSETVMRMGCYLSPAGIGYINFANVNGSFVSAESVITIHSPEEAIEYLKYFRSGSIGFLIDEQAYNDEVNAADLIEHSPIRKMHVIDNGSSFIVRVNVVDPHSSEVRYERWVVTTDGTGRQPSESLHIAELHYAV